MGEESVPLTENWCGPRMMSIVGDRHPTELAQPGWSRRPTRKPFPVMLKPAYRHRLNTEPRSVALSERSGRSWRFVAVTWSELRSTRNHEAVAADERVRLAVLARPAQRQDVLAVVVGGRVA
jgi:hypothetical protein